MEQKEFEIPLEEYRERAAKLIAALYDLPCPELECAECPSYFPTPHKGPYVGCIPCRLQERFNPEVKP